jgi:ElaB/YqjD/DUF883 family membrane-anchored ribosome-binding protein
MDQTVQPQTAAEVAGATMTEVADAARDQYENVLGLIRKRPITSAAIAAGVGFTLALILR